jgi:hypothetical protein
MTTTTTTTTTTTVLLGVLNCFALKSPIYVGSVRIMARTSCMSVHAAGVTISTHLLTRDR